MENFKWGIIGPGHIANKFAKAVKGLEGMEVHAVASNSLERADIFAKEYDIPKAYDNYEKMLVESGIDGVYIATVNSVHYENIMLCLEKKVPVLCEKPMVMKLSEFDNIMKLAIENNVLLMEAMWTNFIPSMTLIKKFINEGEIGKISIAFIDFCTKFVKDPESRIYNKNLGGGLIFDIGVYNLHTAFNLFGENYKDVVCCGKMGETLVDAGSFISFLFDNGVIVNTSTCGDTKGPCTLRVCGDKGYIFSNMYNDSQSFTITYDDGTTKNFNCPYDINGFEYEIKEFVDLVKNSLTDSSIVSLNCSRKVCEVMEMAYNKICNN